LKIALIGCGGRGTGAVNDFMNAAKILEPAGQVDRHGRRLRGPGPRVARPVAKQWAANIDVPEERIFTDLDNIRRPSTAAPTSC
jgi:predicted dehydrogenase